MFRELFHITICHQLNSLKLLVDWPLNRSKWQMCTQKTCEQIQEPAATRDAKNTHIHMFSIHVCGNATALSQITWIIEAKRNSFKGNRINFSNRALIRIRIASESKHYYKCTYYSHIVWSELFTYTPTIQCAMNAMIFQKPFWYV